MNNIKYKTLGILAIIVMSGFISTVSAGTVAENSKLYQGLVSYYEFEDNFADQFDRNNGKLNRDAPSFVGGLIGKAYHAKGHGAFLSLGPDIKLGRKSFSIQVWAKLDYPQFKHNVHLFQIKQRAVKDENMVFGITGNQIKLSFFWNDLNNVPLMDDYSKWTHIVATNNYSEYDKANWSRKIYVNGKLAGEDRLQGGVFIGDNGISKIGVDCEDTAFDNVGIWYRSLDADDVSALYNDGKGMSFGQINTQQPTVKFTNPAAGQVLRSDDVVELKWNAANGPLSLVTLEYTAGNDQWQLVENNIPATGNYLWEVPYLQSDNVHLRITDISNGKQYTQQKSFSIKPTVVTISDVKLLGSKFSPGRRAQIRWDSTGRLEKVKIMYSVNGKKWISIDDSTENDGIYVWRMPWDLKTRKLSVRVTGISGTAHADSDRIKVDR